jgi:hypothetical protein
MKDWFSTVNMPQLVWVFFRKIQNLHFPLIAENGWIDKLMVPSTPETLIPMNGLVCFNNLLSPWRVPIDLADLCHKEGKRNGPKYLIIIIKPQLVIWPFIEMVSGCTFKCRYHLFYEWNIEEKMNIVEISNKIPSLLYFTNISYIPCSYYIIIVQMALSCHLSSLHTVCRI